ncbi:hypothetical protein [Streptomyces sp. NPDC127105]
MQYQTDPLFQHGDAAWALPAMPASRNWDYLACCVVRPPWPAEVPR